MWIYFQDGEGQREKQASKLMESELKMAHEELVKVKNRSFPYFRERTQEQSWNITFFTH